jgi:hypothetical protein
MSYSRELTGYHGRRGRRKGERRVENKRRSVSMPEENNIEKLCSQRSTRTAERETNIHTSTCIDTVLFLGF